MNWLLIVNRKEEDCGKEIDEGKTHKFSAN